MLSPLTRQSISDCSFLIPSALTPSFPPNMLTPVSVLPPLQAFFNDKYMQEHPEDLEKIEKLKDLIAWQVRLKFRMHVPEISTV